MDETKDIKSVAKNEGIPSHKTGKRQNRQSDPAPNNSSPILPHPGLLHAPGNGNGNDGQRQTRRPKSPRHTNIWLPDQPGAWAMALLPAIGGIIIGGVSWRNIWLLAAWALCYCFQFSVARWLGVRAHEARDNTTTTNLHTGHVHQRSTTAKERHSNTYFVPAIVYAIATAIIGIPVFVFAPKLLWWIPVYAVLAVLSFVAAWLRRERTLWGNAVAVIAAGGMALLSTSLGSRFFVPALPHESLISRLSPVLASNTAAATGSNGTATTVFQGNPLTGSYPIYRAQYYLGSPLLPKAGVIAALAFVLTEYASVLFVKTMIREHGHIGYYALSVVYHVALIILGFAAPLLLSAIGAMQLPHGVFGTALLWDIACIILLLRATTLPLGHKRMKPLHIGMIEAFTSLMNLVVIVVALA